MAYCLVQCKEEVIVVCRISQSSVQSNLTLN